MSPLLFGLPGNAGFTEKLSHRLPCETGVMEVHHFPDGESCPRFLASVSGRDVVLACALDYPNAKIVDLYLAACVARELGARSVGLVIPYLPYMRQDARFRDGEGITSVHFAHLISGCCDWLVTVDPHLHRYHALSEIYSVATRVVRAAPEIARWIAANVERPVIVGPDSESEQWVAEVAAMVGCPSTVLQKIRSGDREVKVSVPDTARWAGMTPVLVDDIVSTARTMIAATGHILAAGMVAPVCVGVHALFAGDAYEALRAAGVGRIVSCNTVEDASNAIDICQPVAAAITGLLAQVAGQGAA